MLPTLPMREGSVMSWEKSYPMELYGDIPATKADFLYMGTVNATLDILRRLLADFTSPCLYSLPSPTRPKSIMKERVSRAVMAAGFR